MGGQRNNTHPVPLSETPKVSMYRANLPGWMIEMDGGFFNKH